MVSGCYCYSQGDYPTAVYKVPIPPIGYCITRVVEWIYGGIPAPKATYYQHLKKEDRTAEIVRRYKAGESSITLAKEFGMSDRRVRYLVKRDS